MASRVRRTTGGSEPAERARAEARSDCRTPSLSCRRLPKPARRMGVWGVISRVASPACQGVSGPASAAAAACARVTATLAAVAPVTVAPVLVGGAAVTVVTASSSVARATSPTRPSWQATSASRALIRRAAAGARPNWVPTEGLSESRKRVKKERLAGVEAEGVGMRRSRRLGQQRAKGVTDNGGEECESDECLDATAGRHTTSGEREPAEWSCSLPSNHPTAEPFQRYSPRGQCIASDYETAAYGHGLLRHFSLLFLSQSAGTLTDGIQPAGAWQGSLTADDSQAVAWRRWFTGCVAATGIAGGIGRKSMRENVAECSASSERSVDPAGGFHGAMRG